MRLGLCRRGSQDSNLESPVLETGASATGAALPSQIQGHIAPRESQRETTGAEASWKADADKVMQTKERAASLSQRYDLGEVPSRARPERIARDFFRREAGARCWE